MGVLPPETGVDRLPDAGFRLERCRWASGRAEGVEPFAPVGSVPALGLCRAMMAAASSSAETAPELGKASPSRRSIESRNAESELSSCLRGARQTAPDLATVVVGAVIARTSSESLRRRLIVSA